MHFISTRNGSFSADLRAAVLQGLAPDGGLFMPSSFEQLSKETIKKIPQLAFQDVCLEVAKTLFANSLPHSILAQIIRDAITFDAPLIELPKTSNTAVLELFHGPTLSFKDFGARFMARLMAYFVENKNKELSVLVATSGDTGSAVASGFFHVKNIRVYILYPSGGVSDIQEKQLTTYGDNITALEIKGTFDDCQKLTKQAFLDNDLKKSCLLTSANSINVARLFPQSFYYAWAYAQSLRFNKKNLPLVCCVPSGNFGNLSAGLIAKRIGVPFAHFIAATNINDVVPSYLKTGIFMPRPSCATISNAMDVGNPSNFARMMDLYMYDHEAIKKDLWAHSFSDKQTREEMGRVYDSSGYVLDPHGAVASLGMNAYRNVTDEPCFGIFFETAHPAKFSDTVVETIGIEPEMPERLRDVIKKEKKSTLLSNQFNELKSFLLS